MKIIMGLPGRDEQIENYIKTLHNMGKVGIPVLGHHFCPTWAWRTTISKPYRCGATVSAYNQADEDKAPNAYAVSRYHMINMEKKDNPPLPVVAGVERIFISKEDFLKAEKIADNPAWGINLCMGTFSQLGGEECVLDMIREFAPKKRIHMVHFRDVQGTVNNFSECFLGEGRYNPCRIMRELSGYGYEGLVLDDHVPYLTNDTRWGHTSRAYEFGYICGMASMMKYDNEAAAVH